MKLLTRQFLKLKIPYSIAFERVKCYRPYPFATGSGKMSTESMREIDLRDERDTGPKIDRLKLKIRDKV